MGSDRHYPEVPGSPAPMSGAIHIFSPDKVTLLGVPPLCLMEAISSRGLGLREMVEGVGADQRAAHAVPGRSA